MEGVLDIWSLCVLHMVLVLFQIRFLLVCKIYIKQFSLNLLQLPRMHPWLIVQSKPALLVIIFLESYHHDIYFPRHEFLYALSNDWRNETEHQKLYFLNIFLLFLAWTNMQVTNTFDCKQGGSCYPEEF